MAGLWILIRNAKLKKKEAKKRYGTKKRKEAKPKKGKKK